VCDDLMDDVHTLHRYFKKDKAVVFFFFWTKAIKSVEQYFDLNQSNSIVLADSFCLFIDQGVVLFLDSFHNFIQKLVYGLFILKLCHSRYNAF